MSEIAVTKASEQKQKQQSHSHNKGLSLSDSVVSRGGSSIIRAISFTHETRFCIQCSLILNNKPQLSSFNQPKHLFIFQFLKFFVSSSSSSSLGDFSVLLFKLPMMLSARNRSPFTTCQWQELEHQALIYKYMESGVPIPPDLIFPVKRSLDSSRLFPHQPIGWGCFQMGFDRKVDPEPGRCRRTDGKKWRCSKEAFPDSKYCERHMHRSRNRSRKPAEANTTQPIPPITKTITPSSYSLSSSMVAETYHHHLHHPYYNNSLHPFIHPNSSSRPQNNTTHLVMNSGSYSQVDENNRYFHGLREVDEHAFFSMDSGSLRNLPNSYLDDSWRMRLQSLTDLSKEQQQQQKEQHFFALGTDFKSERLVKMEKEEEPLRPLRHFFDDLPPKNRDSWHDSVEEGSNQTPFLTTQLSISIPMSSSDFHVSN